MSGLSVDHSAETVARSVAGAVGERRTVSIMKACALADVSRRTIYNWLQSGKLQYVRTAGGSVRIFVDTLFRLDQP